MKKKCLKTRAFRFNFHLQIRMCLSYRNLEQNYLGALLVTDVFCAKLQLKYFVPTSRENRFCINISCRRFWGIYLIIAMQGCSRSLVWPKTLTHKKVGQVVSHLKPTLNFLTPSFFLFFLLWRRVLAKVPRIKFACRINHRHGMAAEHQCTHGYIIDKSKVWPLLSVL